MGKGQNLRSGYIFISAKQAEFLLKSICIHVLNQIIFCDLQQNRTGEKTKNKKEPYPMQIPDSETPETFCVRGHIQIKTQNIVLAAFVQNQNNLFLQLLHFEIKPMQFLIIVINMANKKQFFGPVIAETFDKKAPVATRTFNINNKKKGSALSRHCS